MSYVLDSSAVLATMLGEIGGDCVMVVGKSSQISTVNFSEVIATLTSEGMPFGEVEKELAKFEFSIVEFGADAARLTGRLRPATRSFGLSLGDRACLAQAKISALPVLTADRRMAEAAATLGIEACAIRG